MKNTRKLLIEGYIEMREETIKINKEWEKIDTKWPIFERNNK